MEPRKRAPIRSISRGGPRGIHKFGRQMEKGSRVPCDARVADGAIRGGFVGLLWAGFYGPGEYLAAAQTTASGSDLAFRF